MKDIDALFADWDTAHWEFTLAFEGLADEDLWRRADPRLLSVGELAGHVAYWESRYATEALAGNPLADQRFGYYTHQVGGPVRLELGVAALLEALKGVHAAAKEAIAAHPDLDAPFPPQPEMTWAQKVKYSVFHVAYHCGQAYSVRHLLGHDTTDN